LAEHELCDKIRLLILHDTRVLGCTDLTVLKGGPSYQITLTCKIDKSKTLAEVHQIISELETQLYQQFTRVRRFTIHAEPAEDRTRQ